MFEKEISYRTIKPGKYSELKTALEDIGANTCLATIKKFENKELKAKKRTNVQETRCSEKEREVEVLLRESRELRKQVERERKLKDEAQRLKDLAIQEREASHLRHEHAIQEAWEERRVFGDGDVDQETENTQVERNKEQGRDEQVRRLLVMEGREQETSISDEEHELGMEAERLKDITLKGREQSHLEHEQAVVEARGMIEFEREQRARVGRELEKVRRKAEYERLLHREEVEASERFRSDTSPWTRRHRDGEGEMTPKQRSKSESEQQTDRARGVENKSGTASGQHKVASSWDEDMLRRGLGKAKDKQSSIGGVRRERELTFERRETVQRELAEWREKAGFDERSEDVEEWEWLTSAMKQRERSLAESVKSGATPINGSQPSPIQSEQVSANFNGGCENDKFDLNDLDAILQRVWSGVETNNLSQVKALLKPLGTETRKAIMSLKVCHKTVVFHACVKGHVPLVEYFLSECAGDTEELGEYVSEGGLRYLVTPLWWAAFTNQQKMVQALVAFGAHVDAELGALNSTAVLSACSIGNVEVVKYLVAHGADLLKPNANGETCLHKSVQSLGLCQFLLNHGARVNVTDGFGRTPLHHAVESGPNEVVRLLVRRGADVRIQDCSGKSALQMARRNGRDKVVGLLLKVMELNRVSEKVGNK